MVQRQAPTVDEVGTRRFAPAGDPIAVPCNAYPLTMDEDTSAGFLLEETYQLVVKPPAVWPGDAHSIVTVVGVDGEFDCIGPPKRFGHSHGVQSTQVLLRKRG